MTITRINNRVPMTTLTKAVANRIHDTTTYRYTIKEYGDHAEVIRLPLAKLDTTAALTDWETVADIH